MAQGLSSALLGTSGLRYYALGGSGGPTTGSLDVGAMPGTDVYSPVDGTIVGITPYVLDGKHYGARIDVQPSGNPSIVVSLTHLRPDPSLTVGSPVAATTSKLGTILDFAGVERQALARVTQNSGNHVAIEVHRRHALDSLKILFVADVFGVSGRHAIEATAPPCARSTASTSASSTPRTSPTARA